MIPTGLFLFGFAAAFVVNLLGGNDPVEGVLLGVGVGISLTLIAGHFLAGRGEGPRVPLADHGYEPNGGPGVAIDRMHPSHYESAHAAGAFRAEPIEMQIEQCHPGAGADALVASSGRGKDNHAPQHHHRSTAA